MLTWEMLKELTETNSKVFKTNNNSHEDITVCFLDSQSSSVEYRLITVQKDEPVCDNVITYLTDEWVEISMEEANVLLKGNWF